MTAAPFQKLARTIQQAADAITSNVTHASPLEEATWRLVQEADRLHIAVNTARLGTPAQEVAFTDLLATQNEIEAAVLRAPCLSHRLAAAKLRLGVVQDYEHGERTDGLGRGALQQVMAFLEAAG